MRYDGVGLLSGGLDSILAIKLVVEQGLSVLGLHFVSPFYGKPGEARFWADWLGIDLELVDVSDAMARLVTAVRHSPGGTAPGRNTPLHGYGSVLNPCVDCKVVMMDRAREYMERHEARCIISGEVLGQRPMSQRRDTLNVISRDGGVKGALLRPLCAKHMTPTTVEESGLVNRERLAGFSGRGRKEQLAMAAAMGLPRIPSPGGGCMLTEKENARRYWPLVQWGRADGADFHLANVGRQLWDGAFWLSVGRNQDDNERFQSLAKAGDVLFKTVGFPGPLALGRRLVETEPAEAGTWPEAKLREAAAVVASYSPKAVRAHEEGREIQVRTQVDGAQSVLSVTPTRQTAFQESRWETARDILQGLKKTVASPHEDRADI